MLEMMIDLETLDTRPNAVILSIGAVVWEDEMETDFQQWRENRLRADGKP